MSGGVFPRPRPATTPTSAAPTNTIEVGSVPHTVESLFLLPRLLLLAGGFGARWDCGFSVFGVWGSLLWY